MNKLLEICERILNDANLDIFLEFPKGVIILDFVAGGSLENIVIRCGDYVRFRVSKDKDEKQSFFVGKTSLCVISSVERLRKILKEDGWTSSEEKRPCPLFRMQCEGEIILDIVCGSLSWNIDGGEFQDVKPLHK